MANYGYIRYSDKKSGRGSSVTRQKNLILDRCPDIDESLIYKDEGVSGWNGDLLKEDTQWFALNKVLADGDVLYVEAADRITRGGQLAIQNIVNDLRMRGITVLTTVDGKRYEAHQEATTEEGIVLLLAGSLGKAESDNKSRRITESYTDRNRQAALGIPKNMTLPSWVEFKDDKYSLNEKASTVAKIFELCIDGLGMQSICKELNKAKVEAFKGGTWSPASVHWILKSKTTYGTYTPSAWKRRQKDLKATITADDVPDYFPKAVTEETYWQAQESIRQRARTGASRQSAKPEQFNLFQGVAMCSCGGRMHILNKGVSGGGRWYICATKARQKTCTNGNIKEGIAERVFKELLTKINVVELLENRKPDIDVLSIETELSKQRGLYEEADKDLNENGYSTSLGAYLRTTEQKIKELEAKLSAAKEESLQAEILLTDKQWLMQNIKLETREQRYRANMLLKKLNITVGMWRDTKTNRTAFYALGVMIYLVEPDGVVREVPLNAEADTRYNQHNEDKAKDYFYRANVLNMVAPKQEVKTEKVLYSLESFYKKT
nr:recombinase family protein [uncultured Undibacterium sp.]